jgi:3-methyladenine DNA glycosylase Tag
MDEHYQSPEDLIIGMSPDEICELLDEIGIDATCEDAEMIQELVEQLGSLEEALESLRDDTDSRAA